MPSRGYTTSSRQAQAPSAFYEVFQTDFGVTPTPAATVTSALAYSATGGSLGAGSTAYVNITWVTAQGESFPSGQGSVSVPGGGGSASVVITQPSLPSTGAAIIGWRIYDGSTTTTYLATTTAQITETQQNFVTTQGTILAFPIATTTLHLKVYSTNATAAIPTNDLSGIQTALPSIGANTTVDYYVRVPNSSGLWEVQKSVGFMRPQGTTETAAVTTGNMDCIAPLYPGTSQSVTAGTSSYFVMNGYLFWATTGGTTASTFPGLSAFSTAKGGTTTDGTVTWTCLGKQVLIRVHFSNSSGSAATPVAQEYDFFLA